MQGTVNFYCYDGMTIPLCESNDREELRSVAASYLMRLYKCEAELSLLEKTDKGNAYESIGASDSAGLFVGEDSGKLILRYPVFPTCRECGSDLDENNADCCNEVF